MKRNFLIILMMLCCLCAKAQDNFPSLQENIIFFYNSTLSNGKDIKVSGFDMDFHVNTYDILAANGIIDSIFVRSNEKQMQKIDSMNWTYSCDFKVTKKQLSQDLAILNMEHLDGNCEIFINRKSIGKFHNSFLTYTESIKPYLKKGKNHIDIKFSQKDSVRMRQRSPQYLYGWDWHPTVLAPRIGSIYITFEGDVPVVESSSMQTLSFDSTQAKMLLTVDFRKPLKESTMLYITNHRQNYSFAVNYDYKFSRLIQPNADGRYTFELTIDNPELWWPNGSGQQWLYSYNVAVGSEDNVLFTKNFGIRTIKLIRDKDQWGETFYFKVNNRPVFAKGANYIMTYGSKFNDVMKANQANMNMLRVWGGGDYGDDSFYDLCDEYGIMVWQDYPFSTELYPADRVFLNEVEKDATQNVKRIAAHPSLALLCGNNEIWEGWWNWGWKTDGRDTTNAVRDYDALFNGVLKDVSKKEAQSVDYIHSSPVNWGWGHEESRQSGDCHYWGVWWGDSNFETYTRKIPRFMSEYGFQSVMNRETAEKYASHPYTKDNEGFAIHQKHPRGFELIDSRIKEWFGSYSSDKEYMFFSQATQQEGLKLAIEHHRLHKPYCMGSLFWQYNEPYPCVGWGCLDYSGNEKPCYYTAMMSFQPVIFAIDRHSCADSVFVYACSDIDKNLQLNYSLRILDNNDSVQYGYIQSETTVKANESKRIAAIAYKDIKGFSPNKSYLWVEGYYNDVIINNYSFFTYPKDYVSIEKYLEVIFDYYFGEEYEPASDSETNDE